MTFRLHRNKTSVIAKVSRFGDLQARFLPALCKYFQVSLDEFLNCDLSAAFAPGDQQQACGYQHSSRRSE